MQIDHVVFEVRDPVGSIAFYAELLGFEAVRLDEFRAARIPFPSVRVATGTIIDLFPRAMWRAAEPRNPNHICFAASTAELTAIKQRLAARSIPLTKVDDHNFGALGFGRSIYFDDPDGISIEVRDYPDPI
jgi:catechol 2,3-dioxygenase-like lactoylglutathione lyase family enzyme